MENLPKSTHLWSDRPSMSPGCCSGAALLLSFPWYVPNFSKITTRPADGNSSGMTPRSALVHCFLMSPVFQIVISWTEDIDRDDVLIEYHIINLQLLNWWKAVPLISHLWKSKTLCLWCFLKRSAHHKRQKLWMLAIFILRGPMLSA